eukprot:CAMPEP_0185849222 /NCGR_PEP_ID=MMETSP1354-20130828/3792_1 /TAXON_ID=708628 /ORGANISM="Erythrolobus madagascarensis, Strain CCMP3276" /LENGTH=396 /DNA_ID=CAMNT_0028549705 /DNA_START=260 /DNA_END=1450 /DNA_ORIENTATION=-
MINVGTNIMKLAINKRLLLEAQDRKRLMRTPQWLLGFGVFVLGTLFNFGAFKFAAQSLLAGLSSVQFISQLVFSKVILKEDIAPVAYFGVLIVVGGCVSLVVFGQHHTKNYGPEELAALFGRAPYVCYMLMAASLSCFSWVAYTSIKQSVARSHGETRFSHSLLTMAQRQMLAVLYAIRAGIWGSQSVVLAKALSMLLAQLINPAPEHGNPLKTYETYFILLGFAAAATFWMLRLNHALKLFDALYMIPMMQLSWMLFSSLSGGIFYEEFVEWQWQNYVMYALSFSLILFGVVLLCPSDTGREHASSAAEAFIDIVEREMSAAVSEIDEEDAASERSWSSDLDNERSPMTNGKNRPRATAADQNGKRSLSPSRVQLHARSPLQRSPPTPSPKVVKF